MPTVLDWKKIDPRKDFRYSPPKQAQGHAGYSVRVEVFDNETGRTQPFIHQAPALSLPFGLSSKESANGIRYMAVFSFPTVRRDPSTGDFHGDPDTLKYMKFIEDIDNCNKEKAVDQCQTWFKKSKTRTVIDEFYFHNLYVGEKAMTGEYSPTFTSKLQYYREKWESKFFRREENGKIGDVQYEDLSGSFRKVIPILETTGMWFAGKQFGMSFRVVQLLVFAQDKFEGCVINTEAMMDYEEVERPMTIKLDVEDAKESSSSSYIPASSIEQVPVATRLDEDP